MRLSFWPFLISPLFVVVEFSTLEGPFSLVLMSVFSRKTSDVTVEIEHNVFFETVNYSRAGGQKFNENKPETYL